MRRLNLGSFLAVIFGLLLFTNIAKAEVVVDKDKRELVQNLVNEAVDLIKTKWQSGVEAISDKKGRFNTKDAYVFITSETGADLINPAFKDIEGMPLETYSDPTSKEAQMIIVNALKDKDTAWVEYLWPKPGETKPSKKISYLRKLTVNGKVRIIGAGFYPEK